MKYLIYTLAIVLSILSGSIFAQVTQEWVAIYNNQGNSTYDEAFFLVLDGPGNVYVTGISNADIVTIKYNSSGVQQWVARYNGPGNSYDCPKSFAVDGSGNVYVTGYLSYAGYETYDYLTIKYNSSGVQQWVQSYNGTGNDFDQANSIGVDGSGNVYVTGESRGDSTSYDYATIKYNSTGVQQWVVRSEWELIEKANSLAVDGSGNIYVTGYITTLKTWGITYDYYTIKYNLSGIIQWEAISDYYGLTWDEARYIKLDATGNVYVTGESYWTNEDKDYCTIKYNSSGVQQWVLYYNGTGDSSDCTKSLAIDGYGNVYVTGYSYGSSTSFDYATVKYNSSGVQQWIKRYNGTGNDNDEAHSLAVDGSGNVYVTGYSFGTGTYRDYVTVRYNSSGVQQWVQRYNGTGNSPDVAHSLAVDGTGNVYVTGYSWGPLYLFEYEDYATIKYSQQIGIKNISSEVPSSFSLSQNFPNPFNPTTNVQFSIPNVQYVTLKIYDALGREIETLVNEKLVPGTYEVDWNGSNYPSGVYFYRLMTDNFNETKKMLMIK